MWRWASTRKGRYFQDLLEATIFHVSLEGPVFREMVTFRCLWYYLELIILQSWTK